MRAGAAGEELRKEALDKLLKVLSAGKTLILPEASCAFVYVLLLLRHPEAACGADCDHLQMLMDFQRLHLNSVTATECLMSLQG